MLEGEEGKKHGNVQQQKTMTTCFEGNKNLVQGVHNMHLFLQLSPQGLKTWLGVEGESCRHMWDTDAHTEHLHRPAPQNLEHKGCTFKSMHRPTMRIVV